jgi:Ca2+-binding RTX toxin-like protein
MNKFVRIKASRTARQAASGVAVAAAVVGAAGIAAAQGAAAPAFSNAHKAHKASHVHKEDRFKRPKLSHGLLAIEGTGRSDKIALRLRAGDPDVLQVDVGDDGSADFSFRRAQVARSTVDSGAGDDLLRIDESNGAFTNSIPTTIDGGDGNDTLVGGSGAESLIGGDGNDSVDGNGGNDTAFLGAGDDTFVWDPGDGSDIVEGQSGADTMRFNGANIAEHVDLSANGNRLRFFRDIGNITMDTAGVERVDFNAFGGADTITVNDLAGTDVTSINADLAAIGGGGDGQPDHVIVNGTNGDDRIAVTGGGGRASVTGLQATVNIGNAEPANDTLTINALAGADVVDASGLAATTVKLELNGGDGVDTLTGSAGGDLIDGNHGNDVALLGAGDDTFVWDPGDGSDTVEGQAGTDTMRFNGAAGAEQVSLSANKNRLKLFRDLGNITMDTAGVERVDVNALGGADVVTVGDLSGTDVSDVNVDLAGALGGVVGDGQSDRVVVNATNGTDSINVNGDAGRVKVSGLAPTIEVLHSEAANDRLEVNTLAGADNVDSGGLAAGALQLFVDGVLVP